MLSAVPTRTLVQEIDDIRAGRWDVRIRSELGLPSEEDDMPPTEPPITFEAVVEEAKPARPPSVEMELEEAAEVQESAESAEAVRSLVRACPRVALTMRSYSMRKILHRHKRCLSQILLQLTCLAR